jgi:hypothetical protein
MFKQAGPLRRSDAIERVATTDRSATRSAIGERISQQGIGVADRPNHDRPCDLVLDAVADWSAREFWFGDW